MHHVNCSFEPEEELSEESSEESEEKSESPKRSIDVSEPEQTITDAVEASGKQQIGEDSPWDRYIHTCYIGLYFHGFHKPFSASSNNVLAPFNNLR